MAVDNEVFPFPDDEPKEPKEEEASDDDDDVQSTAAYHLERNAASMHRIDRDVKKEQRHPWLFIREESLADWMDDNGSSEEGLLTMQDAAALHFEKPIGHPVRFNVNQNKRRLYAVWNSEGMPGPDDEPDW